MIRKCLALVVLYAGAILLVCESLLSSIQMKSISKGDFKDHLRYNYSYFGYSYVGADGRNQKSRIQLVSCRVYRYSLPVSSDEKLLFLEMGTRQLPGDCAEYIQIRGFRPAIPSDSIEVLPLDDSDPFVYDFL